MHMSETNVIIAQRSNDKAGFALSSFVHALYELEHYAVGRLVTKEGKPPLMVLLAPFIEPDYECLIEVQLPFDEDVRRYQFPPLDKVVTTSGKEIREHRNLPSDELQDAMGKYLKSIEILDEEYDDEPLPISDYYSPVLHRVDSAVRFRAVNPDLPLPPVSKTLTKWSHMPEELVEKSRPYLQKVTQVADIKKGIFLSLSLSLALWLPR